MIKYYLKNVSEISEENKNSSIESLKKGYSHKQMALYLNRTEFFVLNYFEQFLFTFNKKENIVNILTSLHDDYKKLESFKFVEKIYNQDRFFRY